MAYAALVSVSQTLQQILHSDPYFFPCSTDRVKSFQETIASLITFLDNCPPICTHTVNNLTTRIRDSAYEAEDAFESLVANHFLQKYERESYEKFKMLPQSLDKVMEDIELIKKEAKDFHQDGYGVHEHRIQTLVSSLRQLVFVIYTLKLVLDSDPFFLPFSEEKVASFREAIASLIDFLDNCAPIRSPFHNLMTELRYSACKAADVFESLIATHSGLKYGSDRYEKFKMFPRNLETVIEGFESIEKEVKKIHQEGNRVHEHRILTHASSTRPASRGYNNKMVALDNDMEMKLLEQLVRGQSKIDIIPIVGMGGIGKTILARILCDSKLIKETFEVCGCVTISETYSAQEIVLRILKDIGVHLDGKRDGEQHLYQSLYDRKYLIVLDDVWNTQAWDEIKRIFPDKDIGSRIMLTKVAAYANTSGTYHEMQLLNENSSWRLLCQEIFLQNHCPPELVEVGKEIASQCQGLPLAISAIGGHLKKEKQTEEYWKYVSENVSSVLKTTNDPSLEILTLSYIYLPQHLKACFLYFGSFQEDDAINVSEIINSWVAEGFVKPSRSNSMEKVAEEYLSDVIERNLVFVYVYDSFGKPKKWGIHDLFRDICIREAKREKFLSILGRDVPFDLMEISSQRRLILSPNIIKDDESPSSSMVVSRTGSCSATRSFICHDDSSSKIKLASGLLKVLKLRMDSVEFPVEIFELVNLKYLQLRKVKEIPSSISRLSNLQTLVVWPMFAKISMPSEIWEMSQLRHIRVFGFRLLDIPEVQGKGADAYVLKSLQTLEVLTRIPNLKKLNLSYDSTDTQSFHSLSNLVGLSELESLHCSFRYVRFENISWSLTFPFSLKKLVLEGCEIPWEQMTIIGILHNLEVLKLMRGATVGNLWETNDEEFKQLKFL